MWKDQLFDFQKPPSKFRLKKGQFYRWVKNKKVKSSKSKASETFQWTPLCSNNHNVFNSLLGWLNERKKKKNNFPNFTQWFFPQPIFQIIWSIWIPIKILHSIIATKGQLTSQGAKLGCFTVKETFAQTSLDQNSVCKFPEDKAWILHHPSWSSKHSQLPPDTWARVTCLL